MPYTVETLQDFIVLDSGQILTLGGLQVGGNNAARSIELYDSDGAFIRAWRLDRTSASGVFDPANPKRMLIWQEEGIEGVQLIEVSGTYYAF